MENRQTAAAAGVIMMEMKNRLFDQGMDGELTSADHGNSGMGREGTLIDLHKKWDRLLSIASCALDVCREKTGNDID